MTSGEFHRVPTEKIWLIRAERQRRDLSDISTLADSIRRLGLIHPLVIDRDFKLCAGERRLEAIKMLGHDFVMCQFLDELDPLQKRAVELEENIKRVNLSWQEQYSAVTEYHKIRKLEYEKDGKSWVQEDTEKALGIPQSEVSKIFTVEKEVKRGNSKILEAERLSTAYTKASSQQERRAQAMMEAAFGAEERIKSVINADFLQWALTYDGPKFNFLHCDFPYGIEADKRHQGTSVDVHGGYSDTEEVYWRLLATLCTNLDQLCTESTHIMFWFSMHYYADTIQYFADNSDFIIDPFPLIWLKSDGVGLLPDPQRGPRRIYETCLFGSRGDRKIVSSVANAYAAPTDRAQHMSTKPEPVLRHFFRMFVDENSTVLDPTCGSGSALRAAESLGAAHILGVEINKDFTERANLVLDATRRMKVAVQDSHSG
jgi:hypothetical protein